MKVNFEKSVITTHKLENVEKTKKIIGIGENFFLSVFIVSDIILLFFAIKYTKQIKNLLFVLCRFYPISYDYINTKISNFLIMNQGFDRYDAVFIYYYYLLLKVNIMGLIGILFLFRTILFVIVKNKNFLSEVYGVNMEKYVVISRFTLINRLMIYFFVFIILTSIMFFTFNIYIKINDNVAITPMYNIAQTGTVYLLQFIPSYLFVILYIIYNIIIYKPNEKMDE